jgi:hypothetical protein
VKGGDPVLGDGELPLHDRELGLHRREPCLEHRRPVLGGTRSGRWLDRFGAGATGQKDHGEEERLR